jgi:hypothetical protein
MGKGRDKLRDEIQTALVARGLLAHEINNADPVIEACMDVFFARTKKVGESLRSLKSVVQARLDEGGAEKVKAYIDEKLREMTKKKVGEGL